MTALRGIGPQRWENVRSLRVGLSKIANLLAQITLPVLV
jgi:hypothetical protein